MDSQDVLDMKNTLDKKLEGSKEAINKEDLRKLFIAMTDVLVTSIISQLKENNIMTP